MIEVTFTESAGGSMKYAKSIQNCNPRDVLCLPLGLSMGDISIDAFSEERTAYLQSLVRINDAAFRDVMRESVDTAREAIRKIRRSTAAGEPIRVWYSDQPDEICGFYHLMSLLDDSADIRVIKLPEYEINGNTLISHSGWGDVDPGRFGAYLSLEQKLPPQARQYYAHQWRALRQDRGQLRAVINGRLQTVGPDFYDGFLLRELDRAGETFHEAHLIGNVLGRNQLGISDWLIAARIEEFISRGILEPVTQPEAGDPIYHRILRKTKEDCHG